MKRRDNSITAPSVQATRHLAVILDRTENFDRALEEYRRAITQNPKDAELFNNLGYGYYCRGEWESAEKQLRKAVSLDPKLAAAWTNLGMCLAQQMRYEESLAAFEKVVLKAQAHCNLGFIQLTQARAAEARNNYELAKSTTAEARRNYEMALETEPGLQIARAALQKLGHPNSQNNIQQAGKHASNLAHTNRLHIRSALSNNEGQRTEQQRTEQQKTVPLSSVALSSVLCLLVKQVYLRLTAKMPSVGKRRIPTPRVSVISSSG